MNPNINKMAAALLLMAAAATSLSAQTLVPRQDPKKATWGYAVESSEKWSVKPQYETAEAFSQKPNGKSRAFVSKNGKKGLLDENGKVLGAGIVFEEIVPMQGDAMMVTVKGKKGVANYDGVYLVKPEIETVEPLGNEGFIVTVKGKKGLLAHDGSYIIDPVCNDIDASVAEYFIITIGGKAGLLKRDGSIVLATKDYTGLKPFKGNYWTVNKGKKEGVLNLQTKALVLKPEYDKIEEIFLNGKVFIVKKGDRYDVMNADGKRKFRFNGLPTLDFREIADQNALFIQSSSGNSYMYSGNYDVVNKINYYQIDLHGFTKTCCEPLKGEYYSSTDKIALNPFGYGSVHFSSPSGKTSYIHGKDINKKLFWMTTDNKSADLFKVGEYTPIGTISMDQLKEHMGAFKLTTGSYVDLNGDPMDIITFNGENVGIHNLKTGKYMLVHNDLELKSYTEYDMINPIKTDRSYNYMVRLGNSVSLLSSTAKVIAECPSDGFIEIGSENGYTKILDHNGRMGLKDGDKIVIPTLYDNISMLQLYDRDNSQRSWTDLFRVSKDGKMGLYDVSTSKMVVPLEKGYTYVGGHGSRSTLGMRLFDSDLCYVQMGEDNGDETIFGLWNMNLGKEILAPAADNGIKELPKGYKGFESKGVAYTPTGAKLKLKPMIDVYQADWANGAPHFFVKEAGLEGRTIEYQITAYKNGAVYKDRFGEKCIYTFSQHSSPTLAIEYGPKVTAYLGNDIYLPPYSTLTLKFVLTARDAKTGASIPVNGEKSITMSWERGR